MINDYNDIKFYTVPRIGYERRIASRPPQVDLLSSKIPDDISTRKPEEGGMSEKEVRFWIDLAKKEYFFDEDRNEEYKPEEENVEG